MAAPLLLCAFTQMSAKLACLALALAILAVACTTPAAADDHGPESYDCQAKFGAACTTCVNVTVTSSHDRRLLASRKLQSGGRGHESDNHDSVTTTRTVLTCTDCSGAPNFVLKAKSEWTAANGGVPAGECSECPTPSPGQAS